MQTTKAQKHKSTHSNKKWVITKYKKISLTAKQEI